jgi:hypothetical protein
MKYEVVVQPLKSLTPVQKEFGPPLPLTLPHLNSVDGFPPPLTFNPNFMPKACILVKVVIVISHLKMKHPVLPTTAKAANSHRHTRYTLERKRSSHDEISSSGAKQNLHKNWVCISF